jgi:hypothetical protein
MENYNKICVNLRPIVSINGERRSKITALFNEYGSDGIKTIFAISAQSDFLNGGGERGWKADFDWLIDANNCQKVLEGKYDNDKQSARPLPLPNTGQGYFFVPTPNGVIEMPINPIKTAEPRAAPYSRSRNKNGVNTMAILQQMLDEEEFQREDVAV